eukprot:s2929_g2.t1
MKSNRLQPHRNWVELLKSVPEYTRPDPSLILVFFRLRRHIITQTQDGARNFLPCGGASQFERLISDSCHMALLQILCSQ